MTKKIRAVMVDDEPGNIITLTELIKSYCPQVELLGSAPDSLKGYDLIREKNPDVVFLDIEMPYGNAFDLLDRLMPVDFEVIFITAFNNYAVKAFRYAALDYLLKPVNIEELKNAVERLERQLAENNSGKKISTLLSNIKLENPAAQKIGITTNEGLQFEYIDNIMYLEAEGSYTRIFFQGEKNILASKNLKEYEELLPDTIFCRTHHSYIINLKFVKKYYKGRGGYVELEDGKTIEVSARKRDEFLEKFIH